MATKSENKTATQVCLVNEEEISHFLTNVVNNYFHFLCEISHKYLIDFKNKEINKRKFEEIRQELFEFVKKHRKYIDFGYCAVYEQDDLIFNFDIKNLDST